MPNIIDRLRESIMSEGELVTFTMQVNLDLAGSGTNADMPIEMVIEPYGSGDDVRIERPEWKALTPAFRGALYSVADAFVKFAVSESILHCARDHNDAIKAAGAAVDMRIDERRGK